MEQTLYLDIGNSRLKAAAYQQATWHTIAGISVTDQDLHEKLKHICKPYHHITVASVRRVLQPGKLQEMLGIPVTGITRFDIPADSIRYKSVDTLGIDRYLACLGAWNVNRTTTEASSVIVSDAGTACTVDVMDREGVYLGGVIMPGLSMMIDALGSGADGLFDVSADLPVHWPPDTTEAALQAGTAGSFLAAWQEHVKRHLNLYPDASVWITGGDAPFLEMHASPKSTNHPHLVFEGMRCFLQSMQ